MKAESSKKFKLSLKILLFVFLTIILIVIGYLLYVIISYSRIDDNISLDTYGKTEKDYAKIGEKYTIVTQNLGFGAYTPDFTFFMDGGKKSWAKSKESVIECIGAAAKEVSKFSPDFILFQEVDTDSTRSYHVDQRAILTEYFSDHCSVSAVNYHSAFLMYPLTKPHGRSNSVIMTFSNINITASLRRKLPISTGFSKFLDLDRCYSVSRIPVENGKELVIYNVHLSAYGGSDEIRASQMNMLFSDMKSEYDKGNYCICGGDFNHDFTGDSTKLLNGGESVDFGWAQPFPMELLPDCLIRCTDYATGLVPTCRNCDIPYEEGNFVIIVDGFIVSENVDVEYLENIYTGFSYSDHSPVVMRFSLK